MPTDQPIYISQGIDYLGLLNAKLRDLSGWATLLNELVQNADDAKESTKIIFDVTDDALIVENDGSFTNCGAISDKRCGLDLNGDGRICCDFHGFFRVASGHKRQEDGTTGAFGIGFISVYQITDQPTLHSGKWFLKLRPEEDENKRIEATEQEIFPGTRFVLPWAKTPTNLRSRLGIEPVPGDVVDRMCRELDKALFLAAPFLKRLQRLELRKRGSTVTVVKCTRDQGVGKILIDINEQQHVWKQLAVTFDIDAQKLRDQHPRIEAKRQAKVTVAISLKGLSGNGRLYATLPTEDEIGLPVLINADFFPSSDRKRILFDPDYQGDWNRAAIRAAAHAIAESLEVLRNDLEPAELWKLFKSAKELKNSISDSKQNKELASFWTYIQPKLKQGTYILSSTGAWCTPGDIRLLQSYKDESPLLPFLVALNQSIVHSDLQPFSTLLRDGDIGVRHFSLDDLSGLLIAAGLTSPVTLDKVPLWLRSIDHRQQLGTVIEKLYERVAKDAKQGAEQRISSCSLVLSTDGRLTPAKQLRSTELETRKVFADICPPDYWASDNNPNELIHFVARFSVKDAVILLQHAGVEAIRKSQATNKQFAAKLIAWFANNHLIVAQSSDLKTSICALPIWLSGTELHKLNELSIPGGFKDPLSLARILDPLIAESCHGFLVDVLQAKELTLETYLVDQVPGAFANEDKPSAEVRQSLMNLLITHRGKLLDNASVAHALRRVPIVRCIDGEFRCGRDIYFRTNAVIQVLGDSVSTTDVTENSNKANYDVLCWLGVRSIPVADDILHVINATVEGGATQEHRELVQIIFKGLAEYWQLLEGQLEDLKSLKNIAWLPSKKTSLWHKPNDIYSVLSDSLFESQATFLDIPRNSQTLANKPNANGISLLDFLVIKTKPPVLLVVNHLLFMANHGNPFSKRVYEFLDDNANEQPINLLRGKKCLCLENNTYIEPGKALWGSHRFGRFRIRLSPEWRQYQNLLKALGVSDDEPLSRDVVAVLQEISSDYADNRKLDDSDYEILIHCWALLSEHLNDETASEIDLLKDRKVVANNNHFLTKPKDIFFDDRPGLVELFEDDAIRRLVILRPETAFRAMNFAGVRLLSEVVTSELVHCDDQVLDDAMTRHLDERWPLIRRLFATQVNGPATNDVMSSPEVWQSQRLAVAYRILEYSAPVKDVPVHLTNNKKLFVCTDRKIWHAVAKELVFAYFPDGRAGTLASSIKDVLLADDIEAAKEELNELGISNIDFGAGDVAKCDGTGMGTMAPESAEDDPFLQLGLDSNAQSNLHDSENCNSNTNYQAAEQAADTDEHPADQHLPIQGAASTALSPSHTPATRGATIPVAPPSTPGVKVSSSATINGGTPLALAPMGSPASDKKDDAAGADSEHKTPPKAAIDLPYGRSWGATGGTSASSRPKRGQSQPPRTKTGRLLSYAEGPGDADKQNPDDDPTRVAARKATERAAVDYFMTTQAGRWKSLTEMPFNNRGFDIRAIAEDDQEELIEVKGQSGAWTEEGVALTPPELETAMEKRDRYWLCIVEYAQDDKRRQLYLVRNPYGLTQQFRFDVGWKSVAESVATVPTKPAKYMYIDMPGVGRGQILSVRDKGRFFTLHVILEGGSQVYKPFNPATMKLSAE